MFCSQEPSEWRANAYLGEYRFVREGTYRTDTGVIEFRVDTNAPDRLYYTSASASYMGGMVNIVNGEEFNVISVWAIGGLTGKCFVQLLQGRSGPGSRPPRRRIKTPSPRRG